jgi:hypothetical protein
MPVHSYNVATTISAYRAVMLVTATAYAVEAPDTATAFIVGVTDDTVRDTTNSIPVKGPGERAFLYFQDTVSAGELVGADTSGRGIPFSIGAATTTAMTVVSCYVGPLIGPAVSATGTIAEILVAPGFVRGTR